MHRLGQRFIRLLRYSGILTQQKSIFLAICPRRGPPVASCFVFPGRTAHIGSARAGCPAKVAVDRVRILAGQRAQETDGLIGIGQLLGEQLNLALQLSDLLRLRVFVLDRLV